MGGLSIIKTKIKFRFRSIPLWIIPLILALLFFSLSETTVFPDSELYLTNALNIYKGYGNSLMNRGPVFTFLIALSFWLFDVSIKSAFLVSRSFYLMNIVLTYFVAKKFYGKWVGLISSLLVFTSFTINNWSSYILLDHVVAFFILLFILLIFLSFEKGKYIWFILAGLSLQVAFLVKETALLFLPLPFMILILIKEYRSRENLFKVIAFLCTFFLTIGPWVIFLFFNSDSVPSDIFGAIKPAMDGLVQASDSREMLSPYQLFRGIPVWLSNYYKYIVIPHFALAPLFFIAWIYTFLSGAVSRRKPDLILSFSFLLFLPIMIFQGKVGLSERQGMILFFISYITIANFLIVFPRFILAKLYRLLLSIVKIPLLANRKLSLVVYRTGLIVLICFIIALGLRDKTLNYFIDKSTFIRFVFNKEREWDAKLFGGRPVKFIKSFSEEMLKNIPPGSRFLTDTSILRLDRLIYFFSNGEYTIITNIPYLSEFERSPQGSQNDIQEERTLFLSTFGHRVDLQSFLLALTEKDLLNVIKGESIDYILLTEWGHYLNFYFNGNPNFVKVMELGRGIQIYRVDGVQKHEFETVIGRSPSPFLNNVKKREPIRYDRIVDDYLKRRLGWTDEKIDRLVNSPDSFTYAF